MKTLYNNYCNSKQGYLLLLISQFVTNQICSHVTDLLSFVSLAFCAIRQISCRIICFIYNVTYELSASSAFTILMMSTFDSSG